MSSSLVWFKNDLRVFDNPALYKACENNPQSVTALFFITPKQWQQHHWGANKAYFVLRNLKALSEKLAPLNIPLLIVTTPTFASIPKLLTDFAVKNKITDVFWNEEYEVNEIDRDQQAKEKLEKNNIDIHITHDQTILPPQKIKTQQGNFYTVFTPYKNEWFKKLEEYRPLVEYPVPAKQKPNPLTASKVPDTIEEFTVNEKIQHLWPAGEKAAHQILNEYCKNKISSYKDTRDYPAEEGTSTLSPYLALGAISAKTCFLKAQGAGSHKLGIQTWINELIWREFYRHILVGFPRVCKNEPFKLNTKKIPWENNKKKFLAWCHGQTGFSLVDAAINQLIQTGWIHNRLRMVVSMFLVKDLHVDWRWGEQFFMQHLIDADFASNNGGWQWAASTGTDAAPYFRIFNPNTQGERFDPQGKFIKQYGPVLSVDPIVDHGLARQQTIELFKKYS